CERPLNADTLRPARQALVVLRCAPSFRFRRPMADQNRNGKNTGRIVEIKGVVLDAVFPDRLPEIYSALSIDTDHGELIAEVQQHLGDARVPPVAMATTDGLARGPE